MPADSRATLAYLADSGADLLVKCSGPYDKASPHPVFQMEPKAYLARFGPTTRLCDLEAKYACPKCGAPVLTDIVMQWHRDKEGKWRDGRG